MFFIQQNEYLTTEEVSSIIVQENALLYATYHYENMNRSGSLVTITNNKCQKIHETTGTFAIKTYNDKIYTVNSNNISIDNKIIVHTDTMNMSIDINEQYIVVSHDNGYVTLYDTKLNKIEDFRICEHIIWTCKIHEDRTYAGCDCGKFVVVEMLNKAIIKTEKKESGVTSIHFSNNRIFVGSYDEHVHVYDASSLCFIYKKR